MQAHNVLEALTPTDKYIFVEVEPDRYVEVPDGRIGHNAIHRHLQKEIDTNRFDLRCSCKYFSLYGHKVEKLKSITEE